MENKNIINDFLNNYTHCPICGSVLTIGAFETSDSMKFDINHDDKGIDIGIEADYFVDSSGKFKFSLLVAHDGSVVKSNELNKFLSMYELSFHLYTRCPNYQVISGFNEFEFYRGIYIKFDRNTKSFNITNNIDSFVLSSKHKVCRANIFHDPRICSLSINNINTTYINKSTWTDISGWTLNKFDFSDKEALMEKLQAMQLVA